MKDKIKSLVFDKVIVLKQSHYCFKHAYCRHDMEYYDARLRKLKMCNALDLDICAHRELFHCYTSPRLHAYVSRRMITSSQQE